MLSPSARPAIERLPASRIREVANAGLGRSDVLPFWFGEGDETTPAFIRDSAIAALAAGDCFYGHNLGLAELRAALAAYLNRLRAPRVALGPERIAVTSAGVNALMLAAQALLSPGDRVAVVTPVWPNLTAIPEILGAQVLRVPLSNCDGAWSLDLDRLLDAATPATRMVLVNSPNNPTGWTMPQPQWDALLAHCRRHGIWLVSDDTYERIAFDTADGLAPGVLGQVEADDRVVSANTFSKAWSMTGWRLGWLVAPAPLIEQIGKLIEFNTSCAPPFVQKAAAVALEQGEPWVAHVQARLRTARAALLAQLADLPGVIAAPPAGAMYLFLRIAGASDDSLACAKALVREAGLGLAPGVAFGPEGEGWLRWCFASTPQRLADGAARLAGYLQRQRQ
ncbi:MAG: pyridoxal phosphate-dependent aminotransferase [Betaproteobacteria bacterium]